MLVFDASQEELRLIAQAVAKLLHVVSPEAVSTITLQATHNDDQLWGNFIPGGELNDSLFWQPGLLAPDDDNKFQIVLIPDLAQLSLMAARSAIMLVGEQVASLERHGQHRLWRPGLFWIAGCATSDVGKVSAHLLDRFALRINRQKRPDSTADSVAKLRELLNNTPVEASDFFKGIDDAAEALKTARDVKPQIDDDVFKRLFEYVGESSSSGMRRDLALARLAVAKARLDHKETVGVEHVDEAAKIIGLRRSALEHVEKPEEKDSSEQERPDQQDSKADSQVASDARPAEVSAPTEQQPTQQLVEQLEAEPEPFPTTPLPAAPQFSPYPEDNAAMEHEANPLRLPSHTAKKSEAANGAAIGTERATSLRDLAIARSLLEAAKFQPIRRKYSNAQDQFLILPPDLHSYRREPVAEQMLVLVMDYTSLKETAWEEALFPYIKEAYIERALVCVVKVGAADSRQELRAERVEARSILVPSVAHAFNTEPGRATPLAHGLDLAYQTLRRHLQHGRGGPYRATLVIVSDGRGNVPLESSRKGEISPPVLRRGFDDALSVARQIKALDHVRIVLLNPASDQYPEMPSDLAGALGAQLREIQVSSEES